MRSSRPIYQIFSAIGHRDLDGAIAAALRFCQHEEDIGHRRYAMQLRGTLNGSSAESGIKPKTDSLTVGTTFPAGALTRVTSSTSLSDVDLTPSKRKELHGLLLEWRLRRKLLERDVSLRSKMLFYGPPGCGKSLTATAIANELELPAFIVRFDALIGAYLGQTAVNLRQIFAFAESQPSVLILDELDALGRHRGNPLDVGELDRIVISLLQELEHSRPAGLLIATTNLPRALDSALWRRFDLPLEFPRPSRSRLLVRARQLAKRRDIVLSRGLASMAERTKSFAELDRLIDSEARRLILEDSELH